MNSLLKDAREGASAAEAGSLFHNSIVCGKRLCLKLSVDVQYCWKHRSCDEKKTFWLSQACPGKIVNMALNMTIAVDWDLKPQTKQTYKPNHN